MRSRLAGVAAALGVAVLLLGSCSSGKRVIRPTPSPSLSAAPTSDSRTSRWDRLADAPTERLETAFAFVGRKLHVAGGLGGNPRLVEIYDPATDAWSRGPDLPVGLHHAIGLEFRGAFLITGGYTGGVGGEASGVVWSLGCPRDFGCPRTTGWFELTRMRRPRAAHAAGVAGDRIVVAGGMASGQHIGPSEVFDPAAKTWRDAAAIPALRDHVAGASDGRFLYVIGGRRGTIDSVTQRVDRYDPSADRWTRLADLPTARGGFAAAFASSEAMIVSAGGEGPRGAYDDVEAYLLDPGSWARLPKLPLGLHGLVVAASGQDLYAGIGGPRAGASSSKVLYRLRLGVS